MAEINYRDFWGLIPFDVVGLIHGYKDLISTGIAEEHSRSLEKIFTKHNLRYAKIGKDFDYKNKNVTYLIAKDPGVLKLAQKAYREHDFKLIGKYLGYPKCCVDFYFKNFILAGTNEKFLLKKTYNNSQKLFWQLNNILNFDGRIKIQFKEITDFIRRVGFISWISHNPCSYDCAPSLEIAQKNIKYVQCGFDSGRAHETEKDYLISPILYFNDFKFVVFKGVSGKGFIKFKDIRASLGIGELEAVLKQGDKLVISDNIIKVLKNNKVISETRLRDKPMIFSFDKDYAA